MKTIIKRNLPLNVTYTVINRKYVPLLDGYGQTCDNCGKLISNIATVKSANGVYDIGFDCMETFLLNNQILSGFDIKEHTRVKKMIPKVIRMAKQIKEFIAINPHFELVGLEYEKPRWETDWITWYYIPKNGKKYNTNIKLKDTDLGFAVDTIKNIFPNLTIDVK